MTLTTEQRLELTAHRLHSRQPEAVRRVARLERQRMSGEPISNKRMQLACAEVEGLDELAHLCWRLAHDPAGVFRARRQGR